MSIALFFCFFFKNTGKFHFSGFYPISLMHIIWMVLGKEQKTEKNSKKK